MRSALHYNWARFQNIFLFSPTDAIQTYFGEEVGLYFAFITVYTIGRTNPTRGLPELRPVGSMRIDRSSDVVVRRSLPNPFSALAMFSVVGIWCIVYGFLTLPLEKEKGYVKELCDLELVMCPKCNSGCPFYSGKSGARELLWTNQNSRKFLVKEKCSASVLLHVFDNNNTGKSSNMTP